MKKMGFSNSGPENNRAFYSSTYGCFIKIYQNLLYKYKSTFINKYLHLSSNPENELCKYFQCIRIIRNRCCHSNHIVSIKLKNNLSNTTLFDTCSLNLDNIEKCVLFIYRNLDNKNGLINELLNVLKKYYKHWQPYSSKHSIRDTLILLLTKLKENKIIIA